MAKDNGKCGVGVAFNAKIAGMTCLILVCIQICNVDVFHVLQSHIPCKRQLLGKISTTIHVLP